MRSRLSLTLVLVASLAAVGCADSALTDADTAAPVVASAVAADAPAAGSSDVEGGSCPSLAVTVAGPSTLAPNAVGTYTVSMKPGCSFAYPRWSATNGASIVSRSGNTARIRAGSSSFSARARVVYDLDNLLSGSKSVNVSSTPVVTPLTVTLQNNGAGRGLRVTHGMSASEIDYFRIGRFRKTLATGAISSSTLYSGSSFYYDDRNYALYSTGPYLLSYIVEAIDMSGNVVARGSASGRGDTSY